MPAVPSRVVLMAHPSPDLYGSDRVLLGSVSGLLAAGWRVVVTVPAPGPLVPELERLGAEVAICPAPVLRKAALRPRGLITLAREVVAGTAGGVRLLRRVRPAVVYVNTLTIPWWFVLARVTGRPVVGHVHEAEDWAPPVRWALMTPLRLARAVIANSRYTRRVLAAQAPRVAARTVVVANPVPAPGEVGPPAARFAGRLGYVGRLAPRKGVDVAIRALALLRAGGREVTLDLVGAVFPGYEWYETELRDLVAELGLTPAVTFHGFRPDVAAHLPGFDAVLVPSRLPESFGNVAVEAALAARPVVVTNIGGLPEAVTGLTAVAVVPPEDPRALADGVERLVADWPATQEAAVAGAALLRARHDPVRYGERVADLVAEVAMPAVAA